MEKKKNIILITGKDSVSVSEELDKLVTAWKERQSGDNIHRYILSEISDGRKVREATQAMGLFVERRLFIFSGSLEGESRKKKKLSEAEDILREIIEHIDDDTFLIFMMPSTGSDIEAYIRNIGDVRQFDTVWDKKRWQARYPDVDERIIEKVLRIYAERVKDQEGEKDISSMIRETLEKISLLGDYPIDDIPIEDSITLSETAKMYDLTDAIMRGDSAYAIRLYRKIIGGSGVYAFLPSLIGLMRSAIYTRYLKNHGYRESEIVNILGTHPFVVKKSYQSRVEWSHIRDFYNKILEANTAYRSGRGLHDPELGRNFAIERAILSLKK